MKKCYFKILLNLVWSLSEALHMVRYEHGMSADFHRIAMNADYPEHDPLNLASLSTRQRICDEIIAAKRYIPINIKRKFSEIENVEMPTHPASINFQRLGSTSSSQGDNFGLVDKRITYTLKGTRKWNNAMMRLLECVRLPNMNWFVALTRLNDRMFLMERWKSRSIPTYVAKGILEPMAGYNINFPDLEGRIQLKRYFTEQVLSASQTFTYRNSIVRIAEKMSLCSLTYNEQSRLCSVAFDTLTQPENRHFQEDVRYINYIAFGGARCLNKKVDVVTSTEVVRADVVPCAINRNYNSPQFYVLGDYPVRGTAFILVEKNGPLEVIAHLDKIYVLLDRSSNTSSEDSE